MAHIKIEGDCEQTNENDPGQNPVCLVCSGSSTQLPDSIPIPPRFCGSENCLDPQLWSLYVLTRVLSYPKEECVQLLETFGGLNPNQWFILCESCFLFVEQVYNLEREVTKLQAKAEQMKSDVINRLTDDRSVGSRSDKSNFDVREHIRQHFRKNSGYENLDHESADDDTFISDLDDPLYIPEDCDTNDNIKKKHANFKEKKIPVKRRKYKKREPSAIKPVKPKGKKVKPSKVSPPSKIGSKKAKQNVKGKSSDFLTSLAKFVDSSEPGVYRCKFCSRTSTAESKARYHVSRAHKSQLNREMFSCHICPALCTTLGNLGIHIQQVHERIFKCAKCKISFNSARLLQQHKLEEHPGRGVAKMPSICDQCGLEFSRRYPMVEHRKKFHPELSTNASSEGTAKVEMSKLERKCQHCDIVCCNTAALRLHFKSAHLELYKFKCELCDAIYLLKNNLRIHINSVHEKNLVTCDMCGARLKESSMSSHRRRYCKYRLTT